MKLVKIQAQLKVPKNQTNAFGKYKYRSAEDIVEAVKPILNEYDAALLISDEVIQLGDRFYVKATATLILDENNIVSVNGYAREEEVKKGMDAAQITGSASSYARKYALNGLFAIDDTKDSDATNEHKDEIGEDKRMELIVLLENTIWDSTTKDSIANKISQYNTKEQYNKAYKSIIDNQIK